MKPRSRFILIPSALMLVASGGCSKQPEAAAPKQASAPTSTAPAPSAEVAPATQPAASLPATAVIPAHPYAKPSDYDAPAVQTTELPSGLKVEDLIIGNGAFCLPRAVATFQYRSKVKDGAEFDATAERAEAPGPETQSLSRLMPGLRDGLVGMRVGGRRRLTIPAEQAFSFTGAKDPAGNLVVPPDATVIYVVDLIELKQGFAAPESGGAPKPPEK